MQDLDEGNGMDLYWPSRKGGRLDKSPEWSLGTITSVSSLSQGRDYNQRLRGALVIAFVGTTLAKEFHLR